MGNDDIRALMPVLAILVSAALLWCFLSSCMGMSIRQAASNLWEYSVISARHGGGGRRTFGDEELWEMEHRRRT
ncbi:hypothetical protein DFH05DRAFT_149346 [Lentinula detonsa]|uniref:Uncharacterized protein n=1 Tax=Lentinula detonsa TaxID=2804962 RepID=A0A9W8PC95_9AGAR|nr:hypothetical protein DFH05DRAFT_149346 [Lentinula detonsa]